MPLSISVTTRALATRCRASALATGGTAPYVYSVVAGGAGGTINSSTGFYTAPNALGTDTIRVTDATTATADITIMVGTPLQLLAEVIRNQMSLTDDQVYLWDQKINIPTDSRLYVAVSSSTPKPFGNSSVINSAGMELQSANFQALVGIDILSRSNEALLRKEEVILALGSIYSQQQQQINSFYIAKQSVGFVNISEIDGQAIPYRYNILISIQYMVQQSRAGSYFDNFATPQVVVEA